MPVTPIPPEQWTDPRHRDGWDGESIAAEWLTARGWTVEAHRFKVGRNDLDLVVRKGRLVAFVEVKLRRSMRCGAGEEAIDRRKRRIIERVAGVWILRHGRPDDLYRFDVVTLMDPGPSSSHLTHLESAWRAGWR